MAAPIYQITLRSGPEPGRIFPLEREEIFMGRDLANEITISDPEVSRRHARFILQDDNFLVEDLGSTNGTFLNGKRISTSQQLRSGDVITLGENIVMVFEKSGYDPDATVVSSQAAYPPKTVPREPAQRFYQRPPEPAYPPQRQQPSAAVSRVPEKKKRGFPTWLIIMIIAILVIACVLTITLYFMPASWWCAITFNMLEGCPVP